MNFSALTGNDRTAAIAAVLVIVFAVLSLVLRWGVLMVFPMLAGLAALFVLFQTQVAPNTRLPMARGLLLLVAGAAAALFWVIVAVQWLGYIFDNLISFDVIQFIVGLAASIVLAVAGWRAYQGESATAPAAPAPPAEPPPAEPPPTPPAEPPAAPPSA